MCRYATTEHYHCGRYPAIYTFKSNLGNGCEGFCGKAKWHAFLALSRCHRLSINKSLLILAVLFLPDIGCRLGHSTDAADSSGHTRTRTNRGRGSLAIPCYSQTNGECDFGPLNIFDGTMAVLRATWCFLWFLWQGKHHWMITILTCFSWWNQKGALTLLIICFSVLISTMNGWYVGFEKCHELLFLLAD